MDSCFTGGMHCTLQITILTFLNLFMIVLVSQLFSLVAYYYWGRRVPCPPVRDARDNNTNTIKEPLDNFLKIVNVCVFSDNPLYFMCFGL